MSYGEKVLSRVLHPGVLLIVVGAVAVYGAGFLTKGVQESRRGRASLLVKAVGCAVAIAGAVLLFTGGA